MQTNLLFKIAGNPQTTLSISSDVLIPELEARIHMIKPRNYASNTLIFEPFQLNHPGIWEDWP